ncbi:hypothetical protein FA15DRAFT_422614 [Coprinopsis marcescibilis]|uniref:Uncharacterized protein n=1 Tax=Coprinopsis marcescibilis TaxID=230819 RepID=A0A5C3KU89_COPMA|nr:hypothetical protein FA15DRAFT_422614 [Coprinopsis marcescibilis]
MILAPVGHSFTWGNDSKRLKQAYTQYSGTAAPTLDTEGVPGDIYIVVCIMGTLIYPLAVYTRGVSGWTQWFHQNDRPHHPSPQFQDRLLGIAKPGTSRRVFSWLPKRHNSHLCEYTTIEQEAIDVLNSVYSPSFTNPHSHGSPSHTPLVPVPTQVYGFKNLHPQDFNRTNNSAQIDQPSVALAPVPQVPYWDAR